MKTRLALLLALMAVAGCAKNNASVRVNAVCAVPDDCKFSGTTCSNVYIGQIAVDLAHTNELILFIQVDNLLPSNENANTFKTNTNDAFVHEYELEYVGFPGTVTASVIGSATVPANSSQIVTVNLLPPDAAAQVMGMVPAGSQLDVVAKLRLKGVLADTTSFETGEYEVRGRVCNGTGCADVVGKTCTAPAVPAFCPNFGQTPTTPLCVGGA
jgi:hypothetical protein